MCTSPRDPHIIVRSVALAETRHLHIGGRLRSVRIDVEKQPAIRHGARGRVRVWNLYSLSSGRPRKIESLELRELRAIIEAGHSRKAGLPEAEAEARGSLARAYRG